MKRRSAGILLHPTSLPGRYGIGDLGPAAHAWVEALARAKQTWWQVLPLGPTGAGDSPYQSFSAFAGNPNLVSPDLLAQDGLIAASDLSDVHFSPGPVDYDNVGKFKGWLLDRAWQSLSLPAWSHWCSSYQGFSATQHRSWHRWTLPRARWRNF